MRWVRSGKRIVIWTPGKLNFFLELLARRSDGYHELETLMVPISVFDALVVEPDPRGVIRLDCRWAAGIEACRADRDRVADPWGDLPASRDNLVQGALERLRSAAGVAAGLRVRLVKRIPSQAGLGGASSDAAAALFAANLAWRLDWSCDELARLAVNLGSDVPFFLSGGAAVCRGRGDRVQPLPVPAGLPLVIVKPPSGLPTAQVYQRARVPPTPRSLSPLLQALRHRQVTQMGACLFNRLQPAAGELTDSIRRLQRKIESWRPPGHAMSGSGTSYFVLCRTQRHAAHVAAALRAARVGVVMRASTLGPCLGLRPT
jgi:4-diphosphocytidyl-2-C-methyl-D-erythritol kinase